MRAIIGIFLIMVIGCKEQAKHPLGGFPYPQQLEGIDTSFYYYPIKDVEPKKIAFADSYQWMFYQRFNEPNISLKALPEETLRLSYRAAFGDRIVVILTENFITVKRGNTDSLSYADDERLTKLEKEHLSIFNMWYPIDTADKKGRFKKYRDSMVKEYPQLLDVNYYHKIYERQFVSTGRKFSYTTRTWPVSAQQHSSIFQQIDSSGFWQMPNFSKCNEAIADGELFTLEANTKTQYQAVSMHTCPNNRTKFTVACQNLIRLAKLHKEIDLIWEEKADPTK